MISSSQQNNVRGAVLLAIAALIYTIEVVLVRYIGDGATSGQIVMFRAAAQLVIAFIWVMSAGGFALLRTDRIGLHIARGLVSLFCWLFYYLSFQHLGLALATVLTFSTSLFVVAVAGPILKESVGRTRMGATIVGFVGVLLVSGLGTIGFNPTVLLGLIAAAGGAGTVIVNRLLVRSENTISIMFYIGLVTFLGTLPVAAWDWQPMDRPIVLLGVATGALGAVGMWFTIEAYRVGEVSALASIPYLRLVFTLIVGYLLFAEIPAWTTLAGAAVIVASAIYVTRAERKRTGLAAPLR